MSRKTFCATLTTVAALLIVVLLVRFSVKAPAKNVANKVEPRTGQEAQEQEFIQEKVTHSIPVHYPPFSGKVKPAFRSANAFPSAHDPFGDEKEILEEEVWRTLASVILEKFPEIRLSERDLRRLAENIKTIGETMKTLEELERTRENAEAIKNLRSQLDWTLGEFQETTGMSVAEFIERAGPERGIDNDQADDGNVVLEYIRPIEP